MKTENLKATPVANNKRSASRNRNGERSPQNQPTVGCLFAAIGGFCKAFEQAGAKVLWANEKDRFARETFQANFPHINYLHKPVEELSVQGDQLAPVDILTAGFPCQPFSIAGEKLGFRDERGMLFLHITRIIKEFGKNKPKILLLDIAKNLLERNFGRSIVITRTVLDFLLRNKDECLQVGNKGRQLVRDLTKALNLHGGICLLDCLAPTDLVKFLEAEKTKSLERLSTGEPLTDDEPDEDD